MIAASHVSSIEYATAAGTGNAMPTADDAIPPSTTRT
jgi:hypothetical protein